VSFNSLRDGQGGKTALPIWGEFVKRLQADEQYNKTYFNSWWPEEFRYINDCPFSADPSQLVELNPSGEPDSTNTKWPRQFVLRGDPQSGLGKLIEDVFGPKGEPKNEKKTREEKKNERKERKRD
ncbi:MAG: hypothetical protein M3R25_04835, partial [Bacteroidota bacterium]|nr:hypothetical protein [Bacteroidota bacterium]